MKQNNNIYRPHTGARKGTRTYILMKILCAMSLSYFPMNGGQTYSYFNSDYF